MVEVSNAQIAAAEDRGRISRQTEPRASRARYDSTAKRMIVDLTNGCTFAFPAHVAQGLENASDEELSGVEILGNGSGLHWEQLDVDHSVAGLLAGIFGTKAYMARQAGKSRSAAKAEAARKNGAKGGRPRKIAV